MNKTPEEFIKELEDTIEPFEKQKDKLERSLRKSIKYMRIVDVSKAVVGIVALIVWVSLPFRVTGLSFPLELLARMTISIGMGMGSGQLFVEAIHNWQNGSKVLLEMEHIKLESKAFTNLAKKSILPSKKEDTKN